MENSTNNEFLTVQGRRVPFTRMMVPVDTLELDPKNPRIQFLVGQRAGMLSEQELEQLLWDKESVKLLAQSIIQNGGVIEPLIVQKNGKRYRVREGNSRAVASRHIVRMRPTETQFQLVPAVVFDGTLTEEDLAVLLADMHVAGKIRWDAYEQAKHVHDLYHIYGKPYEWLSNHLRLSKGKIRELLTAYQATSDFLKQHPATENIRKFSFFAELMKKRELRDRFASDQQFKEKFFEWVADEKLTDSKQVRNLDAILENDEAKRELDRNGYEAAAKVIVQHDPTLQSDLFLAIKRATDQLNSAPLKDIHDLKSGNSQKITLLSNLQHAIDNLVALADIKLKQ